MTGVTQAWILDCVSFMPERVVANIESATPEVDGFRVEDSDFFRGVAQRRFASPTYTSGALGIAAAKKLLDRNGISADSVDLVVASGVLTDLLANGIGADIVRGIGAKRASFLNLDTNCTSWIAAVAVARALIESKAHRCILIVTVTNFVSRLDDFNQLRMSRTLGDGASATLVTAGDRPSILGHHEACVGELYGQMRLEPEPTVAGCHRRYWENGPEPLTVMFSQDLLDTIRQRATDDVPRAVRIALERASLTVDDVDLLLTHQPNRRFIDGWRTSLGIAPPRAFDTLEIYGNLFMGSIPVTLGEAIERGLVKRGDIIAAGAFANAGDHVAALVLRW